MGSPFTHFDHVIDQSEAQKPLGGSNVPALQAGGWNRSSL